MRNAVLEEFQKLPWEIQFLLKYVDPIAVQEPYMTTEQLVEQLTLERDLGISQIVFSEKRRVVVIVRRHTPFVCDVHIVADTKNPGDLLIACKNARDWIWKNTGYKKIEMRTPNKRVCKLAEKLGFKHEGTRPNSAVIPGSLYLVDSYEYGLVRPFDDNKDT